MSKPVGPIRPFISSTFRDFQEERGHLNSNIFPQLNSLCYSIGTYFAPVELRWGITEVQAQSGQVVSLCLDNIQRCEPYFICLLGDRYGSYRSNERPPLPTSHSDLPEDSDWLDVSFLNAAEGCHGWVLEDANQNLSVTELEIQEAAFRKRFDHCRFYFRETRHKKLKVAFEQNECQFDSHSLWIPATTTSQDQEVDTQDEEENEECKLKLSNLKQKVVNHGLPVKYFCTADELGKHILDDWRDIIKELQPQLQRLPSGAGSEFYHEKVAHETYAETRRRVFIETKCTKIIHEKLDKHAVSAIGNQRTPSIFTIVGESGCGKSAILANWGNVFQKQHPHIKLIAHYVGSSASSTDITSFLRRAINELGGEHAGASTEESPDPDSIATFRILCSEFETAIANYKAPCIFVVDGINEFGPTSGLDIEQARSCPWIPDQIPKHCKFIISTNASYKSLHDRKDAIIESATDCINNRKDKRNVMKGLLAAHCKKLDPVQIEKVVESRLSHLPLYLTIVANELRVVATFENLNQYLDEYVSETSFEGLWTRVIKRWIGDYGRSNGAVSEWLSDTLKNRVGVNWVSDMLRLIACSRQGLTETEIREIQNRKICYTTLVNGFDVARLRSATFDALFERRGGLLNFFHHHLRKAVHTYLLVQPELKKKCHEILAKYFQETKPSLRRTEELAFQYLKCGDTQKLLKEMTDPQLFSMCSDGNQRDALRLDLVRYWHCLVKSGDFGDEWIAAAYVAMVKAVASTRGRRAHQSKNAVNGLQQSLEPLELSESYKEKQKYQTSNEISSLEAKQASIDLEEDQKRKVKLHEVVTAMMQATSFLKMADIGPIGSRLSGLEQDETQSELVVEDQLIASQRNSEGTLFSVTDAGCNTEKSHLVEEEPFTATYRSPEGAIFSVHDDFETKTLIVDENPLTPTSISGEGAVSSAFDLGSSGSWRNTGFPGQKTSRENLAQDEDHFELARLQMETGKLLIEKACFTQAKELFTNAVNEMKKVSIKPSGLSLLVQIQESLADLYYYQLAEDSAFQYYEEALSTLQKIGYNKKGSNYQQLMETKGRILNRLGLLFGLSRTLQYGSIRRGLQKLQEAEQCMNEANSRAGKVTTKFNMGRLKIRARDFETGERFLQEALRERERWNGRSHPLVAEVLHQLGFGLKIKLKRAEVKVLFERALDIRRKIFGDNHLLVATSSFHLGLLLKENLNQEEKAESKKLISKALHIRETKLGPQHRLTQSVRRSLIESKSFDWGPTDTRRFSSSHSSRSPSARRRLGAPESPHASRSPADRQRFRSGESQHDSLSPADRQRFCSGESQHGSRSPADRQRFRSGESQRGSRSPADRQRFRSGESQHDSRSPADRQRFRSGESQHDSRSPVNRQRFRTTESPHGSRSPTGRRRFTTPESSLAKRNPTGVQQHSIGNARSSGNASGGPTTQNSTPRKNQQTNLFAALNDQCDDDVDDKNLANHSTPDANKTSQKPNQRHKSKPKKRNKIKTHDHNLLRSNKTETNSNFLYFNHWKSVSTIFLIMFVSTITMYFFV